MRNVVRNQVSANKNSNYDNDITRAIDDQIVIAPQYGNVGGTNPHIPPQSPNNTPRYNRAGTTKQAQYQVRQERTRDLKLHMEILRAELALVDAGKSTFSAKVVAAMRARLDLMSQEKARRDLRDLAGGKLQQTQRSFHSLGARARVA